MENRKKQRGEGGGQGKGGGIVEYGKERRPWVEDIQERKDEVDRRKQRTQGYVGSTEEEEATEQGKHTGRKRGQNEHRER